MNKYVNFWYWFWRTNFEGRVLIQSFVLMVSGNMLPQHRDVQEPISHVSGTLVSGFEGSRMYIRRQYALFFPRPAFEYNSWTTLEILGCPSFFTFEFSQFPHLFPILGVLSSCAKSEDNSPGIPFVARVLAWFWDDEFFIIDAKLILCSSLPASVVRRVRWVPAHRQYIQTSHTTCINRMAIRVHRGTSYVYVFTCICTCKGTWSSLTGKPCWMRWVLNSTSSMVYLKNQY